MIPENVEVAIRRMRLLADTALGSLYEVECQREMRNACILLEEAYKAHSLCSADSYRAQWPEPKVTNPDIPSPTAIPYINCLIHRVLDAQQDINHAANEGMIQSLCDAAALLDEVERALRTAAVLHAPPQRSADTEGSVFDRIEEFFRTSAPFGYAKDNQAIERFLAAARDHLSSDEPQTLWQSIETAPRDEAILVSGGGILYPIVASWSGRDDESWRLDAEGNVHMELDRFPTHWMPLPSSSVSRPKLCGGDK